jgi:hypothetical protein
MSVHGLQLEFLGPQHGDNQIAAERDGNDSKNEVFHKIWSELFTANCINAERHESPENQSDIDCVQHNSISPKAAQRERRDNAAILFIWVNLVAANFAAQRLALPNACEISCRAWP